LEATEFPSKKLSISSASWLLGNLRQRWANPKSDWSWSMAFFVGFGVESESCIKFQNRNQK